MNFSACILTAFTTIALGQTVPKFDTFAITPSTTAPTQRQWSTSGWKAQIVGFPLATLIEHAYRLKPNQLVTPDWMKEAQFDITAIMPDDAAPHFPEMLREQLVARFDLQVHKESLPSPAYRLEVTEGGLKLEPADAPAKAVVGEVTTTVESIAILTVGFPGRPIVDGTGLKGLYRVRMQPAIFTTANPPRLAESNQRLEEYGLRLTESTVPAEMLVVDKADRAPKK